MIELDRVSFSYSTDRVLHDLSLQIDAGEAASGPQALGDSHA